MSVYLWLCLSPFHVIFLRGPWTESALAWSPKNGEVFQIRRNLPPTPLQISQPLQNCIGPTIRIGREILCLLHAGFFLNLKVGIYNFTELAHWAWFGLVVAMSVDMWIYVHVPFQCNFFKAFSWSSDHLRGIASIRNNLILTALN